MPEFRFEPDTVSPRGAARYSRSHPLVVGLSLPPVSGACSPVGSSLRFASLRPCRRRRPCSGRLRRRAFARAPACVRPLWPAVRPGPFSFLPVGPSFPLLVRPRSPSAPLATFARSLCDVRALPRPRGPLYGLALRACAAPSGPSIRLASLGDFVIRI